MPHLVCIVNVGIIYVFFLEKYEHAYFCQSLTTAGEVHVVNDSTVRNMTIFPGLCLKNCGVHLIIYTTKYAEFRKKKFAKLSLHIFHNRKQIKFTRRKPHTHYLALTRTQNCNYNYRISNESRKVLETSRGLS